MPIPSGGVTTMHGGRLGDVPDSSRSRGTPSGRNHWSEPFWCVFGPSEPEQSCRGRTCKCPEGISSEVRCPSMCR
jgi:hypothetical protein